MTQERYPVPLEPPRYSHPPVKLNSTRRISLYTLIDVIVAVVALGLTLWLAAVVLLRGFNWSWVTVLYLLVFWGLVAYLALPRLHQLFTTLYVPDYFIGRTRTGDGVLGDPINLAVDGTEADIHAAMRAAGWTKADEITARSAWGMIVSSITGRSYPAAPVSGLHLFGRWHAFAYQQEVDGNPAQRHHVRFWRTPQGWVLPGGQRVDWLAAGTYDRSVGLSAFTGQITHKIDADIDIERDYIIDTVRFADPQIPVRMIDDFSTAYHHRNGGGDQVHTDGHLPILDVSGVAARSDSPALPAVPQKHEHALPPIQLLVIGFLLALQILALLFAGIGIAIAGGPTATGLSPDDSVELLGSAIGAVLATLLWLGTLARWPWARILLMLVCAGDAVQALWGAVTDLSASALLGASVSVLVLLAITADPVRAWVTRDRTGPEVELP